MKDWILSILVINALYFVAALYGMIDGGYGFKEIGILMVFVNGVIGVGWILGWALQKLIPRSK